MSDPVTNVEIEDVLSSIRRLVSDGDKARTRDTAPVEEAEEAAQDAGFEEAAQPESHPVNAPTDRLVLTPAFLVVDDAPKPDHAPEPQVDDQDVQDDAQDDHFEDQIDDDQDADNQDDDKPLELTNMVWDAPEQTTSNHTPAPDHHEVETIQTPDRSELVATIAELEAAISTDDEEYEPDGSEVSQGEPMAQTIAWPGTFARPTEGVEEAEVKLEEDAPATTDSHVMPFQRSTTDAAPEFNDSTSSDIEEFDESEPDSAVEAAEVEADVYADDDLDDLIEAGGVTLDEEALRAMVAEVVREELTGPLGERITRNVRKLVRREIYRVLSSQEFD